jgi:hypothetical protein
MAGVPNIVYRVRDLIEGAIPRDGAINAAVHVGVVLAGTGAAVAVGLHKPDEDPAHPEVASSHDFLHRATMGLAVGAAPLFLTAGMMMQTPGGTALARGVTPNYFLAAGAVLGAAYLTHTADKIVSN